ncbi:hypothetical protein [Amycolatopsis sp. NPDC051372]|uniref:hypothetical protein n=1 Tax=Amycolatopsis sp. NPDC051372 TaxID=3155669 RepID=UPI003415FE45
MWPYAGRIPADLAAADLMAWLEKSDGMPVSRSQVASLVAEAVRGPPSARTKRKRVSGCATLA